MEVDPRPRLRGKLHAWAFPAAVALAVALIWSAPAGVPTVAAAAPHQTIASTVQRQPPSSTSRPYGVYVPAMRR